MEVAPSKFSHFFYESPFTLSVKWNIFHSQFLAKNVMIYAFFSGKIVKFGNLAIVKDLTNSMSVFILFIYSLDYWNY